MFSKSNRRFAGGKASPSGDRPRFPEFPPDEGRTIRFPGEPEPGPRTWAVRFIDAVQDCDRRAMIRAQRALRDQGFSIVYVGPRPDRGPR